MNVHEIEAEEKITEEAIARGEDAKEFDARLTPQSNDADDLMALFLGGVPSECENGDPLATDKGAAPTPRAEDEKEPSSPLSLFPNDLAYIEAGLHYLRRDHPTLNFEVDAASGSIKLDAPGDLQHRYNYFPQEVRPQDWRFELTADKDTMARVIEDSRKEERDWPRKHFLWRQSPVVEWLNDRLLATFGRHEAPVMAGVSGLEKDEVVFAFSGVVPNRKSHPLVCVWGAAVFRGGNFEDCTTLETLLLRTGLDRNHVPNTGAEADIRMLRKLLPEAVEVGRDLGTRQARRLRSRVRIEVGGHACGLGLSETATDAACGADDSSVQAVGRNQAKPPRKKAS